MPRFGSAVASGKLGGVHVTEAPLLELDEELLLEEELLELLLLEDELLLDDELLDDDDEPFPPGLPQATSPATNAAT